MTTTSRYIIPQPVLAGPLPGAEKRLVDPSKLVYEPAFNGWEAAIKTVGALVQNRRGVTMRNTHHLRPLISQLPFGHSFHCVVVESKARKGEAAIVVIDILHSVSSYRTRRGYLEKEIPIGDMECMTGVSLIRSVPKSESITLWNQLLGINRRGNYMLYHGLVEKLTDQTYPPSSPWIQYCFPG